MSRTDLIADSFTMIRNAVMAKKETVDVPGSKMNMAILGIMKEHGYIENFKFIEDNKQGIIKVYLKYIAKRNAITKLKKISTPGLRKHVTADQVPVVLRGKGMAILSTSKGIITDDKARELKVGGEVICYIW